MFAIVNKSDLKVVQLFDFPYVGIDSEVFVHLEIPEGIELAYLKAVLIDDVITLVEDPDIVAAKAQAAKDVLVAAAKASFDADVDAQMFATYGTWDRVVANTTHNSWQDMSIAPEVYVPAIFPSVEGLQAYLAPKIAAERVFNIWRIGRLAQRDAEIAAILI